MGKRDIAVILLLAVLIFGAFRTVSYLDRSEQNSQTEMVDDAGKKAALTCYAVEGAYPGALDYLEENYGLSYDRNMYIVIYNAFASNLFPEIHVIEQKAGNS